VARWVGVMFFVLSSAAGYYLLQLDSTRYLALILVWACPMLALQWAYGGHYLWRVRRVVLVGVMVPTVYLWIADRIAIALSIWVISDRYTTGFAPFGLPVEEALFFLLTNLLVVQGLLLTLHTLKVSSVTKLTRPEVV
jgi:lycopene cyclase domain-containing protein